MIKDKYLTSAQAAKLLGFTSDYVRRLITSGKIKAEKVGRNWLLSPVAIKGIKRQRNPRIVSNGIDKRCSEVDSTSD